MCVCVCVYIRTNYHKSVQAKLEIGRRKHIVHPTGFGAYSSTCCKRTDNCAGADKEYKIKNKEKDKPRITGHWWGKFSVDRWMSLTEG